MSSFQVEELLTALRNERSVNYAAGKLVFASSIVMMHDACSDIVAACSLLFWDYSITFDDEVLYQFFIRRFGFLTV
jgi:hypothetical protein